MKRKRVLIVCPYPEDVAPGQRLKYEQYFDYFRENGYDLDIKPFMTIRFWNIIYKKGYFIEKLFWTILGYLKRLILIPKIPFYDGMYIFLNVIPFGTPLMEWIYTTLNSNYIYDIDDLYFLGRATKVNKIIGLFRSPAKYKYLMKHAKHIIVCTPYLQKYAGQFNRNITDISSTINTDVYLPIKKSKGKKEIIIGWSGSHSTYPFMNYLDEVIKEIATEKKIKLHILGTDDYRIDGVDVVSSKWSKYLEVPFIQEFDIGLYPLPLEDEFVYGKSGLKALQYMALGIPTIATAIGAIFRIIKDGENGFLAKTKEEWKNRIMLLIDNPDLREKIGFNARRTVESKYSIKANRDKYLSILRAVI